MRAKVALAASVALHAAVVLVLVSLPPRPTPSPPASREFVDIELVDWVAPPTAARPPDAVTPPTPSLPPTSGDPPLDEPTVTPPTRTPPGRPPSTSRKPAGDAERPPTSEPDPGAAEKPASEGTRLALSGLRAAPRDPASEVPRPSAGVVAPSHRPARDRALDNEARTPADAGFVRNKTGRWVYRDPDPGAQWSAELLPDGRLRYRDHHRPRFAKGPGAGRGLPTKLKLPGAGNSATTWYKRKRRLAKATEALRLKMAVAFAERNIERQLKQLYRDLMDIWSSDRPPRTRRRQIFEIWDECDETMTVDLGDFSDAEPSTIDRLRKSAGERARKKIVAFIRRHLAKATEDEYSAAELRALNAGRVSKKRFAPYAG